jgi:teichuronic acid biosynthesis glycosyltransferase TuaC
MRVLFLVPGYPTAKSPADGIFHKTQAEALARAGAEVEVVGPIPWVPPGFSRMGSRWRRYAQTPAESRENGIRVARHRYLEVPRGNYWAAPHRSYARLARRAASAAPDVVHAHFAYPAGLAAASLARWWGCASALTLHGGDVNVYPNVNRLAAARFRRAVTGASLLFAVAESLAETTEAISGRRPAVLPIGIDLRRFGSTRRSDARAALGLPPDGTLLLFVGRLTVEKGVRELLAAIAVLGRRDVRGVFVGEGPLRAEAEASGLGTTTGVQPADRVPLFMAAADALVLPSYTEGMPTVLIEAGAAGLPVAATTVGGIPHLLGSDRGLLFEPKSPGAAASAIRAMLEDAPAARARAERLREIVRKDYDADVNARALLALYREARERRGAVTPDRREGAA